MKRSIAYGAFTPGAAGEGTLDLSGAPGGFSYDRLFSIWNQKRGVALFLPLTPALALHADPVDGVIIFGIDTTGMDGEPLVVLYDDQTTAQPVADADALAQLEETNTLLEAGNAQVAEVIADAQLAFDGPQTTGTAAIISADKSTITWPMNQSGGIRHIVRSAGYVPRGMGKVFIAVLLSDTAHWPPTDIYGDQFAIGFVQTPFNAVSAVTSNGLPNGGFPQAGGGNAPGQFVATVVAHDGSVALFNGASAGAFSSLPDLSHVLFIGLDMEDGKGLFDYNNDTNYYVSGLNGPAGDVHIVAGIQYSNNSGGSIGVQLLTDAQIAARGLIPPAGYINVASHFYEVGNSDRLTHRTLQQLNDKVDGLTAAINQLHTDLVGIQSTESSILTAVNAVTTAVNAVTTAVTGVHTAITALDTDVQAGNTSLGTINGHVANIDTATSGLASALSTLESAAATTNTDLGQLHTDAAGINALITSGNALLTTISGTLSTISSNTGTANTDLAQLHTDLGTIITDLTTLHSDLGTANTYLSTISTNTTSEASYMATLAGMVSGGKGQVQMVSSDTQVAGGNSISAADSATTPGGGSGQSWVTGTPTAASYVVFPLSGVDTVNVVANSATGWAGTSLVQAEVAFTGTGSTDRWFPVTGHLPGVSGSNVSNSSTFSADFMAIFDTAGAVGIRFRAPTWSDGTKSVAFTISKTLLSAIQRIHGATFKGGGVLPSASLDTAQVFTLRDTATVQPPAGVFGTAVVVTSGSSLPATATCSIPAGMNSVWFSGQGTGLTGISVSFSYTDGAGNPRTLDIKSPSNPGASSANGISGVNAAFTYTVKRPSGATAVSISVTAIGGTSGNITIQCGADPTNDGDAVMSSALTGGTSSDGNTAGTVGSVVTYPENYNGSNWDRQRNNFGQTILASGTVSGAGTTFTADFTNYNARGAKFFLNITAKSGTSPTLDINLQDKDPVSSNYVDTPNASFAQQNNTGTVMLAVYPGITTAANTAVSMPIPRPGRFKMTLGGTSPSFTYSIGVQWIN